MFKIYFLKVYVIFQEELKTMDDVKNVTIEDVRAVLIRFLARFEGEIEEFKKKESVPGRKQNCNKYNRESKYKTF